MPFSFTFDHAQNRFSRLRIGVALAGEQLFDLATNSNCYLHPIVKGVMLAPAASLSGWNSSNTGIYQKLSKSDLGNPAGINEVDQSGTGVRKFMVGAKNIMMQTATTYAANTGFIVELLNYSNGTRGIVLECGWSATPGVNNLTAFRLYGDGTAEVWRGGVLVQSGKISGGQAASNQQNNTIRIYLMPHRVRELLVWSNAGDGFTAVMPDIDEDDTSPEITPAARFWAVQPDVSTNLLLAPLRFVSSGSVSSLVYQLAEAPDGSDVLEQFDNKSWAGGAAQNYRIYGDASYRTGHADTASVSIVAPGGGTFTPNGTAKEIRLKLNLSGNGDSTPMVYGAESGWRGLEAQTDDSESFDVTDWVRSFALRVPDQGGPELTLDIVHSPEVRAGVTGFLEQNNRPLLFELDGKTVVNGRARRGRRSRSRNADSEIIPFTVTSTIEAMKRHRLRELKPFDGMYVCRSSDEDSVFRWLCRQVGVPDSAMEFEDSTLRVGDIAPEVCGEWAEFGDVGASLWEILTRFLEDYLGGWFVDAVPTATGVKIKICSQQTLEAATRAATLYWSSSDAIAAGVSASDKWKAVARVIDEDLIEPEANEIIVTGFDRRSGKAIGAVKRDYAAQDPTLAPSARPANWSGEPSIVGIINAGISTQEIADNAALAVAAKLFEPRSVIEVECEMLIRSNGVPVWRGDKVRVDGVDYLVQSFSVSGVSEAPGMQWRPARYVLSNLIGRTGGMTAFEIAARERRIREERLIQRRNSLGLASLVRGSLVVG